MENKKDRDFTQPTNSADEEDEILANIRWFSKFSLEKRFEIAEMDTKVVSELRGLKIENDEEFK